MDDTLPDILGEWDPGDDTFGLEDAVDGGGGLIEDDGESSGETGDLLDDGNGSDEGLIDDSDSTGGDASDGGELIDDGGYFGEDIFVWDGDLGSEDFTGIEFFVWEPLIPDDFIFEDPGSGATEVPLEGEEGVEDGSTDGTDVSYEICDGWLDFPCFPVDAII